MSTFRRETAIAMGNLKEAARKVAMLEIKLRKAEERLKACVDAMSVAVLSDRDRWDESHHPDIEYEGVEYE